MSGAAAVDPFHQRSMLGDPSPRLFDEVLRSPQGLLYAGVPFIASNAPADIVGRHWRAVVNFKSRSAPSMELPRSTPSYNLGVVGGSPNRTGPETGPEQEARNCPDALFQRLASGGKWNANFMDRV